MGNGARSEEKFYFASSKRFRFRSNIPRYLNITACYIRLVTHLLPLKPFEEMALKLCYFSYNISIEELKQ